MLNSKNFGVPQSRSRIYIVGCYRDRRGPVEILFEPECGERDAPKSKPNGEAALSPFKEVLGNLVKGPVFQRIAYCLYACSARHTGTDWSRTYVSYPDGRVRRLTPCECEGVQGFPIGWTQSLRELEDPEILDSLRYQALGNAVTVPVAKWLAERIANYLRRLDAEDEETVNRYPPRIKQLRARPLLPVCRERPNRHSSQIPTQLIYSELTPCSRNTSFHAALGPTGGTLRYDAIAHISFTNKRLGLL